MSIFKWIRDLFGIRKDIIETKKTKLEIKRLQDEQRIIKPATFEEIKRIDLKTEKLLGQIKNIPRQVMNKAKDKRMRISSIILYLILIFLFALAIYLGLKIF